MRLRKFNEGHGENELLTAELQIPGRRRKDIKIHFCGYQ